MKTINTRKILLHQTPSSCAKHTKVTISTHWLYYFSIPGFCFHFLTLLSSWSDGSIIARAGAHFFPFSSHFLHFHFQPCIDGRTLLPSTFNMHISLLQWPSICFALTESCGLFSGIRFTVLRWCILVAYMLFFVYAFLSFGCCLVSGAVSQLKAVEFVANIGIWYQPHICNFFDATTLQPKCTTMEPTIDEIRHLSGKKQQIRTRTQWYGTMKKRHFLKSDERVCGARADRVRFVWFYLKPENWITHDFMPADGIWIWNHLAMHSSHRLCSEKNNRFFGPIKCTEEQKTRKHPN